VWTGLNFLILVFYLYCRWLGQFPARPAILMVGISLAASPVFFNFFYGQTNLLLAIGIGEFMRAILHKRPLRSGAALALLLLKPQALLLLLPALIIARQWLVLAGFLTGAVLLLAGSLFLAGINGFAAWLRLLSAYIPGLPTNNPELMMNWRSIGIALEGLLPEGWRWGLVIAGMALTAAVSLALWLRADPLSPERFPVLLQATMAATGVVAWHSHVHMGMILLPSLLHRAAVERKCFPLLLWGFGPTAGVLGGLVLAIVRPGLLPAPAGMLAGWVAFLINLYLILEAILALSRRRKLGENYGYER